MSSIKILDTFTANKIAAGEVVERPSSVVKELLENSLDAQATFIQVEIKDGGTSLIKVTDNGVGMDKKDALLAFERHATSKISSASDLDNISSFGFRGEALSSIAAVSQVVLNTSTDNSLGTQIKLLGGERDYVKEVALRQGTSIEIRNIFYNIPARRKFMRALSYETGLITELITKYSLGHPDVRFKLINNNKSIYDTAGRNTTGKRLKEVFGNELASKFIYLENKLSENAPFKAWLAPKEYSRNTRNQQLFFINGRLIRNKELNQSLDDAYHTFLSKGRFPIALIDLKLPFDNLDVNIHPTKLDIKIYNSDFITKKLTTLLRDALNKTNLTSTQQEYSATVLTEDTNAKKEEPNYSQDRFMLDSSELNTNNLINSKLAETKTSFTTLNNFIEKDNLETNEVNNEVNNKVNNKVTIRSIHDLQPLAQLNNTFILAQNQDGLFIIDQHTCHERILYERFMKEDAGEKILSENLLIPINIQLTGKQEGILIKNILTINNLGFIIEHFGTRSFVIRALPLNLKITNVEQFFIDLIDEIGESNRNNYYLLREKVLTMASCKGAIKAKEKLNNEDILFLLKELAKVDNPHTCPHGRPIIYHISMQSLYKIFKRGAFDIKC